jgi:hypothetical protein
MIAAGVAYWIHDAATADDRALQKCHAEGGYACLDVMRAWQKVPDKRALAWQLGSEKCAAGSSLECGELFTMHRGGAGRSDPPLEQSLAGPCERGVLEHCSWLALLVMQSDPPRARSLWERSCSSGDASSCGNLAEFLLDGKGGPTDRQRGMRLLEAACALRPHRFNQVGVPSVECERLAKEKLRDAAPR